MNDTLTISDAELDEMLAKELPCDTCKATAQYMSRGHRCRPPGFRSFRCESCLTAWRNEIDKIIATAGACIHRNCGQVVRSTSDLSDYRPI